MPPVDKDLKSRTLHGLEELVVSLGQEKYLAGYIFSFIHTSGATDISEITPLSKLLRTRLMAEGYFISSLKLIDKLTDPDGTIKFVFGLPDDNRIESVLLRDADRRTLCVSTQIGCAMRCVFCATGRLGLARNLTAAEIVDQLNLVARDSSLVSRGTGARLTNVVFMGMGEPLENYNAVLDAVRILNHPKGNNIGIRRLTISTCGIPQAIERLGDEDVMPRLAVSLNAPTDAIRTKLMPVASRRAGTLDRLIAAVRAYQQKTRNRVTFEYCMIKGVNDTALHARLLVKRLRGILCNVNLIEYNPHKGCDLRPSAPEAIERFANLLKDAGFETTVRLKMGQTINAACGQLGATSNIKGQQH